MFLVARGAMVGWDESSKQCLGNRIAPLLQGDDVIIISPPLSVAWRLLLRSAEYTHSLCSSTGGPTLYLLLRRMTLPGQKHPTPTPGFGDRVFYETLLRQRPDSAMAQQWCVPTGPPPRVGRRFPSTGTLALGCIRSPRVLSRPVRRCVDYGVLPREEAERYHRICLQRKGKLKASGAASPSPAPKAAKKPKPRVVKEELDLPDMQVSGGDAIGQAIL